MLVMEETEVKKSVPKALDTRVSNSGVTDRI